MEASLLDIMANTADNDCEERPFNRYGSPIARRSSGDVGETSDILSKTKLNEKSLTVIQATAIAAPKILVLMRRC